MSTSSVRSARMLSRVCREVCSSAPASSGIDLPRLRDGGAERVRHAGQILNRAVVEVAGDAPALELGGIDRALQQRLALRWPRRILRASDTASGIWASSSSTIVAIIGTKKRRNSRLPLAVIELKR